MICDEQLCVTSCGQKKNLLQCQAFPSHLLRRHRQEPHQITVSLIKLRREDEVATNLEVEVVETIQADVVAITTTTIITLHMVKDNLEATQTLHFQTSNLTWVTTLNRQPMGNLNNHNLRMVSSGSEVILMTLVVGVIAISLLLGQKSR